MDVVIHVRINVENTLLSPDDWAEATLLALTSRRVLHSARTDTIKVVARDAMPFGETSEVKKVSGVSR